MPGPRRADPDRFFQQAVAFLLELGDILTLGQQIDLIEYSAPHIAELFLGRQVSVLTVFMACKLTLKTGLAKNTMTRTKTTAVHSPL